MAPLATLRGIRLDLVRAEVQAGRAGIGLAHLARRYGFTNLHRFRLAYQQRFGVLQPKRGG